MSCVLPLDSGCNILYDIRSYAIYSLHFCQGVGYSCQLISLCAPVVLSDAFCLNAMPVLKPMCEDRLCANMGESV